MKDILDISKVSKQWWYLWNTKPCCLLKRFAKETDTEQDKSQETRSKILLAAFNEIYERGFQAASLNNILKNTGVTKGGLYHHFKNKQELGYSVLDEVIHQTIEEHWIEPLRNTDDPVTVLKEIIIQAGASMTEENVLLGCPLNNLAQEMSPIDEGFKDRISGIYKEWQDELEAALERGKSENNVNKALNTKELSILFIATLQGCMGLAKSVQNLSMIISCGQGLLERLDSIRPPQHMEEGIVNVK